MGAWDSGSFDNDEALDWLADFVEAPSEEALARVFNELLSGSSGAYREIPRCAEAIAAAEVVAGLMGKRMHDAPDDLAQWLDDNGGVTLDPELTVLAGQAVKTILEQSELQEVWKGSPAWRARVVDLLKRLN